MKKFWKIFGITLGSLLGVIILVIVIACYVVFTPARLTPIVRNVAAEFITVEHEIGEVELTFFSTFPQFGLRINGIHVINPIDGAPSDTLLAAPEVLATVDVMEFLQNSNLAVNQLQLLDAQANIYINAEGKTNFDIFPASTDTIAEPDTTAFSLPFNGLVVEDLAFSASKVRFISEQDSINVTLGNTNLVANIKNWDDVNLQGLVQSLSLQIGNETLADNLQFSMNLPHTGVNLDAMLFTLRHANIGVNEFTVNLNGTASLQDDIRIDMMASLQDWQVVDVLKLVPTSYLKMLDGIDINGGSLSLEAQAKGIFNDSSMPIVDATLSLTNAKGAYKEVFPYYLQDIDLQAAAHLDLNDSLASTATIEKLHASTGTTSVTASGKVTELLADMLCDLRLNLNVNLPDVEYFIQDEGQKTKDQGRNLQGKLRGTAQAKIRLSELTNMRFNKSTLHANLQLSGLDVAYDSIFAQSPALNVSCQVSGKHPMALANLSISSPLLQVTMDSTAAVIQQSNLQAHIEYNLKDSTAIPTAELSLDFADLQGYYTDINAHLLQSGLSAQLTGTRRDKSQPRLKATLTTDGLKANMGTDLKIDTKAFSLTAQARHNPNAENILLQWNPRLNVDFNEGVLEMADFTEKIYIPKIAFDYSNRKANIAQSQIIIGNSDFALTGEVRNIGKWLRNKAVLEGELNFVSEHTDANELMALFSSDSGSEEVESAEVAPQEEEKETQSNPFLVPTTVDLTLNTNIKEAVIFDQLARNLGGKLYIQDGILVLEEMGFICNAAKLQLTAMYKTPRRNHIYCGLDYHMIDINMQELVNMIPQIDTMIPMLRSFRGQGEFHIAAETFMDANYNLKMSTARGACSISGKDLVLLDSETFGTIAKILMFSKKTENKVDSISVEATLFRNEIDIYPFCVSIDNYMAAVGGRHNLDMSFDYHVNLLSPFYIGVDVKGTFDDLSIKPATCRYAKDFRPLFRNEVDMQSANLKQLIKNSLKQSVRIKEEE